MTDAHIAHAFPDLSEAQAQLAVLSETLEMACNMRLTLSALEAAGTERAKEIIASAGSPEEIAAAEKMARATVLKILTRISEDDLQAGREAGLLTPEDFDEALKAKRTLSLSRGRSTEREHDREA